MNDKLYEVLLKLPKKSLLNVMLAALDEMEGYNGQSRTSAVMRAIGAKENEESRSWKMPSIKTIAKEFKY